MSQLMKIRLTMVTGGTGRRGEGHKVDRVSRFNPCVLDDLRGYGVRINLRLGAQIGGMVLD